LTQVETTFAVDSTGFSTTQFGNYIEDKYGVKRERKWIKVHVCVGTKTNTISSVKVTEANSADTKELIPLTKETSEAGFKVKEVYADKAYSSRANLSFVNQLGGTAYVPFRVNSR
jgi:hypothetical protein